MKKRKATEINASSMSDIAFLLLVFFLLVTTFNTDEGIQAQLPPWDPAAEETIENDRNVLKVLINQRNELLVENELIRTEELKSIVQQHVNNWGSKSNYSVSPDRAVISLKNKRETSYQFYISIYDELMAAYREILENAAMSKFQLPLQALGEDHRLQLSKQYPILISEAEF